MHAARRAPALWVLVLAACAGSAPPRAPVPCAGLDEPEGVVCRFYQIYLETRPVGLPTPPEQRLLAPYLTTDLLALMEGARAYGADFEAAHPDEKPPFVDGTLFTSLFEGADRFEIVRSEPTTSGGALVIVRFGYEDLEPWEDTVIVMRRGDRYAIDDIVFSGVGTFNPAGRLTEVLSWRE
jgi:hypothetical protein